MNYWNGFSGWIFMNIDKFNASACLCVQKKIHFQSINWDLSHLYALKLTTIWADKVSNNWYCHHLSIFTRILFSLTLGVCENWVKLLRSQVILLVDSEISRFTFVLAQSFTWHHSITIITIFQLVVEALKNILLMAIFLRFFFFSFLLYFLCMAVGMHIKIVNNEDVYWLDIFA